jgi:hypothetical protein
MPAHPSYPRGVVSGTARPSGILWFAMPANSRRLQKRATNSHFQAGFLSVSTAHRSFYVVSTVLERNNNPSSVMRLVVESLSLMPEIAALSLFLVVIFPALCIPDFPGDSLHFRDRSCFQTGNPGTIEREKLNGNLVQALDSTGNQRICGQHCSVFEEGFWICQHRERPSRKPEQSEALVSRTRGNLV